MMDTTSVSSGSEQPQIWGFAAVPNWLVRDPGVSLHEKIVYLVLSSHIGDQGTWFMSHARIGQEAGISVASVKRALGALHERGVVSWSGRIDPSTGAQLGNSYRIMTDRLGQGELPPSSQGATPSLSVSDQNKNPEEEPIHTPEPDGFEAVWKAWPNKNGKKPAERKWASFSTAKRAEILGPLTTHANAHRQHTPPQYIPMLSTFLNQERWTDPLAVSRERGAYKAEPHAERKPFTIPAGHVLVRDEMTGAITGTRPA